MVRLEAEVPLRADTLFRLLRTMDGKGVIDPFPREHHSEPVKVGLGTMGSMDSRKGCMPTWAARATGEYVQHGQQGRGVGGRCTGTWSGCGLCQRCAG